jgi:hypothetical protein
LPFASTPEASIAVARGDGDSSDIVSVHTAVAMQQTFIRRQAVEVLEADRHSEGSLHRRVQAGSSARRARRREAVSTLSEKRGRAPQAIREGRAMSRGRKYLAEGVGAFVLGLGLLVFGGDIETPVLSLSKTGIALMVAGGIEALAGLYYTARQSPGRS